MNYQEYSVEDFIMDESFQEWVKGGNNSSHLFWENWILQNPHKIEVITKARELLIDLAFQEKVVPEAEIDEEWESIESQMRLIPRKRKIFSIDIANWQKIAASILLVLAVVAYFTYKERTEFSYKTNYGETKEIVLPDLSIVFLNGNSKISFRKFWREDEDRNIDLVGEAFFDVSHKKNDQKFIVHVNGLKVTVLGTQFNVTGRKGNVKVVLNSGKVKLSDEKNEPVIMLPGELVHYSLHNEKYTKKKVIPELYSSWKNNRLEFKNTPIKEIAQLLRDNYGLEIIIKDKLLIERKLTGVFPADNIDILIRALSGVFDLNLTKKGNQLIFEEKSKSPTQ